MEVFTDGFKRLTVDGVAFAVRRGGIFRDVVPLLGFAVRVDEADELRGGAVKGARAGSCSFVQGERSGMKK